MPLTAARTDEAGSGGAPTTVPRGEEWAFTHKYSYTPLFLILTHNYPRVFKNAFPQLPCNGFPPTWAHGWPHVDKWGRIRAVSSNGHMQPMMDVDMLQPSDDGNG
eukprot:scaffold141_cov410-Prasinococcus_capsulatus_cf.AAC.8